MTSVRNPAKFPTLKFEQELWRSGFLRIAGIDEAGRGAWAGPVCTAVVILPVDRSIAKNLEPVRDSKLMTALARLTWAPRIKSIALAWSVGSASSKEIDTIGILPATKLAAMRALAALSSTSSSLPDSSPADSRLPDHPIPDSLSSGCLVPDYLLSDYLIFPNIGLPQTALVKGDRLSLSIASASVLAKTTRDAQMCEMDDQYPGYSFSRHKGYGTRLHQAAIQRIGLCEIHRKSFSIMK
jgi:ribonuclease HII